MLTKHDKEKKNTREDARKKKKDDWIDFGKFSKKLRNLKENCNNLEENYCKINENSQKIRRNIILLNL